MSKNYLWIIIAIVVVLGLGFWFVSSQKSQDTTQNAINASSEPQATATPTEESTTSANESAEMMVKISSNGYSPSSLTVKAGTKVTWMNEDTENHTVNSAPHPAHTDYPPLNTVGLLKPNESKSLTFDTPGTYKYHDHLNPTLFGSVTVE